MRKIICNILTSVCTAFLLSACSEDTYGIFDDGNGEKVTVSLNYQDLSSKEVVVTRATDAENALNNLQVFIFDAQSGNLKGYKYLTASELVQNGSVGNIRMETTTGKVFIYGVANAKTAIYNMVATTEGGQLIPADQTEAWSETDVQEGKIAFTLTDLKKIAFNREEGQKDITESNFMMSGMIYDGAECQLVKGSNSMAAVKIQGNEEPIIRLHRIVAKITFNVKTGSKTGKTITFTPQSYDICNVPIEGGLIKDSGIVPQTFEDFTGGSYSAQAPGTFETYLPENLQTAQKPENIKNWNDREADKSTENAKSFTNAPTSGTYVVLHGIYSERDKNTNVLTRDGSVKYYIHLGYFNASENNFTEFDIKRNHHYTYNVTINGVDSIVVQVTDQNDDEQPGAEGIIFDYNGGNSYYLDSHYDYCVMQFNRDEIKELKDKGYSYNFKIKALDNDGNMRESGNIFVTNSPLSAEQTNQLNGVDLNWAHFLKVPNSQYTIYDTSHKHGGKDLGYKEMREANNIISGTTEENAGMNVVELLSHLYNLDYNSSEWDSNGNTVYMCYVSENYYDKLNWGKYVNIDPRMLYIATTVSASPDERSVHAVVKYTLQQYSIKTFYNTDYDGSVIAYGLETIRDDHKDGKIGEKTDVIGSDHWDGLANMKADLKNANSAMTWDNTEIWNKMKLACMSRNRDLNGDGKITEDEIRWYTPAIDQYAGMWIGENALTDPQVRCYNENTTLLSESGYNGWLNRTNAEHYFSNTKGIRAFWAEEGMSTGDRVDDQKLLYIRCIRNMKTKDLALNTTADKYYTVTNRTVDMSRIDKKALRTSVQQNELSSHTERGVNKELSNVAQKFTYARYSTTGRIAKNDNNIDDNIENISLVTAPGETTMGNAAKDNTTICAKYADSSSGAGTWRAPNQRELCMMYILDAINEYYVNGYRMNGYDGEGCRTTFSGSLRYSWHTEQGILQMGNIPAKPESKVISLRCVRDTK